MRYKIVKYIKIAEKHYLQNRTATVDLLYRHLDYDTIPVCSMSKEDSRELTEGLGNMIKKHSSQPELFEFNQL